MDEQSSKDGLTQVYLVACNSHAGFIRRTSYRTVYLVVRINNERDVFTETLKHWRRKQRTVSGDPGQGLWPMSLANFIPWESKRASDWLTPLH